MIRRPEIAPPPPWTFPPATTTDLGNGLRVLTYDLPGQHVVSLRLVVPFGLANEPAGREGAALLMARLLDEGSTRHTSTEFAGLLERHGMAFGAGVSDGGLLVDVDVPTRYLAPALDLLTEAVSEPVFPEPEVRRMRRSRLAQIEQERSLAAHRAGRELLTRLYAVGERAAIPIGGVAETVSEIERADITALHARCVRPHGATLVVAGDLRGVDGVGQVESSLGEWTRPGEPVLPPTRPVTVTEPAVVFVDRPGSVQTELLIGAPGPDRHVAGGWAPYPVLSFLIGGSPQARIDAILREEKGYTYGIRSAFRPRPAGGTFVVSGSVRSEVTAESVALLHEILLSAAAGFTQEETRSGIDFVSLTAPARFATADAVADEAAGLTIESLPLDFTTRTLAAVRSLTPEALREAYSTIAAAPMTTILVGDAEAHLDAVSSALDTPVQVVGR